MLIIKLHTFWKLGLTNLWRVGFYRLLLKYGLHPVQKIGGSLSGDMFFDPPQELSSLPASSDWQTSSLYFGWHSFELRDDPPDWHLDPFSGLRASGAKEPWWEIPDFADNAGDIKIIWEASRFDWVLAGAQRTASGMPGELQRLNRWLADWVEKNPPSCGSNWKCAQEASIRVLHLLLAARMLRQDDRPRSELVALIEAHLARIAPTIQYAVGQDNNHGTSEAAALFLGGAWLHRHGRSSGRRWNNVGRFWLENRVARLIDSTGSFSQHSVNYHRLMLDTLCLSELWRRWLDQAKFSERFYERAEAATRWLAAMTEPVTGETPNIGANDGANLLPLAESSYRDFRPSLALASALFSPSFYPKIDNGACSASLGWLGLEPPTEIESQKVAAAENFHATGFMVFGMDRWRVVFRYPSYRFRPSQCDQLHVDLWLDSKNWLRDAGSYSYRLDASSAAYFSGAAGHNTVEFDRRDAMPQLGRFLRGAWLRTSEMRGPQLQADGTITAAAAYRDWRGARHHRQLSLSEKGLVVIDSVSGFGQQALLRWRLPQGDWQLNGSRLHAGEIVIRIEADAQIERLDLVDGWESQYYLHRGVVKVLEVCVGQPGQIKTSITSISCIE